MSCPAVGSNILGCDYATFLVNQTPRFDELILSDIRATDGWLLNVSTGTSPMGTPSEITMDRFRHVWPNTTKAWTRVPVAGAGCSGNPCDPTQHQIAWGADRLTYFEEEQAWGTPLLCFDQMMNITAAEQHLDQIISDILKPATTDISSNFLRKRALLWAKHKFICNSTMPTLTFQWTLANTDEEIYFDTNAAPNRVFKLVPQMLQNRFSPLMLVGYAGKNPFKETAPFIELVTDMNTTWELEKLGGQTGVGGIPSITSNWRFTQFDASSNYWKYGFSAQLGNFMVRADEFGLRFNYVTDLGAGANGGNGNRYRYQIVLPYSNGVTSGAGGAAGLGDDVNMAYQRAQFAISFIWHKKGMELLVPDTGSINPEMPFAHRNLAGQWAFHMDNLGQDANGVAINNEWRNKGKFAAWFKYWIRPLYYEFIEVFFHQREQMCVPEIDTCAADPGYPSQCYASTLPACPVPAAFTSLYGTGVPTGTQDGPILVDRTAPCTPNI
jgi:hypothetical protein